jgi:hypothetical protein
MNDKDRGNHAEENVKLKKALDEAIEFIAEMSDLLNDRARELMEIKAGFDPHRRGA